MKKRTVFLYVITMLLTVFNSHAQYTVLHNFDITSGAFPGGSLYSDGIFLYGITTTGGTNDDGVIYKVKPDGSDYSVLLNFDGNNGAHPAGSLISDGNFLYGTTVQGGKYNKGVVFKIKPDGSGYIKMMNFPYSTVIGAGPDSIYQACYPIGALTSDGTYLYGVTAQGNGQDSKGAIFRIKTDSTNYSVIHDFISVDGSYPGGSNPTGSLINDGHYLYGMTHDGGASENNGVIFRLRIRNDAGDNGGAYGKVLDFNEENGRYPLGALLSDGTYLYGMTSIGGTDESGVIFKIKPDGTDYTKLFNFTDSIGTIPKGSLILDNGFLYGMTTEDGYEPPETEEGEYGSVFKIRTDGTGLTVQHYLNRANGTGYGGTSIGIYDDSGRYLFRVNLNNTLISDDTYLYGVTGNGGLNAEGRSDNDNVGVVFRLLKNRPTLPTMTTSATETISNDSVGILQGKYLIASISPFGDNPVAGTVKATVTIDPTVQSYGGKPYVQRHYDIEPASNAATATAAVTLYYSQADFDAYNSYVTVNNLSTPLLPAGPDDSEGISHILISQYHGTATVQSGTSASPGDYSGSTVQINNADAHIQWNSTGSYWAISFIVHGFSGFYISTNSETLPIEISSFSGHLQNGIAHLLWKTGVENNISRFEIEKSSDGSSFQPKGSLLAQGSNSNYSFTTTQAEATAYYRLEIPGMDGNNQYSKVISLSQSRSNSPILYPNPASTYITVEVDKPGFINLYDATGRLLKNKAAQIGLNSINVSTLHAGVYYLDLNGLRATFIKK